MASQLVNCVSVLIVHGVFIQMALAASPQLPDSQLGPTIPQNASLALPGALQDTSSSNRNLTFPDLSATRHKLWQPIHRWPFLEQFDVPMILGPSPGRSRGIFRYRFQNPGTISDIDQNHVARDAMAALRRTVRMEGPWPREVTFQYPDRPRSSIQAGPWVTLHAKFFSSTAIDSELVARHFLDSLTKDQEAPDSLLKGRKSRILSMDAYYMLGQEEIHIGSFSIGFPPSPQASLGPPRFPYRKPIIGGVPPVTTLDFIGYPYLYGWTEAGPRYGRIIFLQALDHLMASISQHNLNDHLESPVIIHRIEYGKLGIRFESARPDFTYYHLGTVMASIHAVVEEHGFFTTRILVWGPNEQLAGHVDIGYPDRH